MSIMGERIKMLRERYGLSQEELAKACGYKGRAAIYLVESGRNEMAYPKLLICAHVLNTTTKYLSGLTDDEKRPVTQDISDEAYLKVRDKFGEFLNGKKQSDLRELFIDLSEEDQDLLLNIADYLLNATDNQRSWMKFAYKLGLKDESLARHTQLLVKDLLSKTEKDNNL